MRIVFRCDASATIGSGHLMRCLTLADALKRRGAECLFVTGADTAHVEARLRAAGHRASMLPGPLAASDDAASAEDATMTLERMPSGADWLVLDHYALGAAWETALRPAAQRILAIDDLASRKHDADILVDPTVGRTADDYRGLTPSRCAVLAGGAYALLRSEFAALRAERKADPNAPLRLHLGFGGGLWPPEAWQVLIMIAGRHPGLSIAANAGSEDGMPPQARSLGSRVSIRIAAPSVAADMARCNAAIGAPGSMTWERFCIGLPFACLTTHPTQEEPVALLRRGGYLADLGRLRPPDEAMMAGIDAFLNDRSALTALSRRGAEAVDGLGCERIADAMLGAAP
jgi:UDP-2,4-diacetamido-2,4,6-trideoxy-beta-L-altropyranose hydrolase